MQINGYTRLPQGSNFGLHLHVVEGHDYADNEDLSSLSFPYPTYWEKNRAPAGFDRTNNLELSGVLALRLGRTAVGAQWCGRLDPWRLAD